MDIGKDQSTSLREGGVGGGGLMDDLTCPTPRKLIYIDASFLHLDIKGRAAAKHLLSSYRHAADSRRLSLVFLVGPL